MSLILLILCTCVCFSTVKGDFWHTYVGTNKVPKCFQVVFNMNAVADRIPSWRGGDSDTTFYFGDFSHWENCSNACAQTPGCASWALHGTNYKNKWSRGCYGVDLIKSQNKKEDNIISGVQITCSSTGLSLDQKCPLGWNKFGDNCYLLVNRGALSITFSDSQDECNREGGFLASIHSSKEKYFLMHLYEATLTTTHYFWIGLLELPMYGGNFKHQWTDGTEYRYDFQLDFEAGGPGPTVGNGRAGLRPETGELRRSVDTDDMFAGFFCKKGM